MSLVSIINSKAVCLHTPPLIWFDEYLFYLLDPIGNGRELVCRFSKEMKWKASERKNYSLAYDSTSYIFEIRVFLLFGLKANEEFCSMKKSWRKHKRCLIYTCSITRGRGTCIEPPLSLERELTLLLLM
ncbi:hypothetical protein LINPERPRIM_LOCUS40332 [Linum perenne]